MALKVNTEKLNKLEPKDAIPLVLKLRNLVFGKKKPDGFTRLLFIINLIAWFIFMLWNALSYISIIMTTYIREQKGISVARLVRNRGEELGFNGQEFLETVRQFHFLNLFVWIAIFIGIVFLYRKKKFFAIFFFGGFIDHFILMMVMLSFTYFLEDTSFFDKILYGIMILPTFVYYILLNKEKEENV